MLEPNNPNLVNSNALTVSGVEFAQLKSGHISFPLSCQIPDKGTLIKGLSDAFLEEGEMGAKCYFSHPLNDAAEPHTQIGKMYAALWNLDSIYEALSEPEFAITCVTLHGHLSRYIEEGIRQTSDLSSTLPLALGLIERGHQESSDCERQDMIGTSWGMLASCIDLMRDFFPESSSLKDDLLRILSDLVPKGSPLRQTMSTFFSEWEDLSVCVYSLIKNWTTFKIDDLSLATIDRSFKHDPTLADAVNEEYQNVACAMQNVTYTKLWRNPLSGLISEAVKSDRIAIITNNLFFASDASSRKTPNLVKVNRALFSKLVEANFSNWVLPIGSPSCTDLLSACAAHKQDLSPESLQEKIDDELKASDNPNLTHSLGIKDLTFYPLAKEAIREIEYAHKRSLERGVALKIIWFKCSEDKYPLPDLEGKTAYIMNVAQYKRLDPVISKDLFSIYRGPIFPMSTITPLMVWPLLQQVILDLSKREGHNPIHTRAIKGHDLEEAVAKSIMAKHLQCNPWNEIGNNKPCNTLLLTYANPGDGGDNGGGRSEDAPMPGAKRKLVLQA